MARRESGATLTINNDGTEREKASIESAREHEREPSGRRTTRNFHASAE